MKLFNSLSREIEDFKPLNDNKVGLYTCGPTVYFYPHIGNWRTFVFSDLVIRTLKYLGYSVDFVMNITDVGHLTGDNLGDASRGEDRLEKAAQKENRTVWDIAKFYTEDFLKGFKMLNLVEPKVFCKATDHIKEQVEMIRDIEKKGFTYKISDGLYFDVGAYEKAGNSYGLMSNIHKDNTESRIEENVEKKDSRDFALWKFSYPGGRDFDPAQDDEATKRQMEWESPWGLGFPGWHIECSAMSRKYLGDQFDIHIGGEDHKSTHHPNEIAQSESATGKKPFVKYWMHGAFLQVDGGRMGKSLGNAYTIQDIIDRGYQPEHLRYFYLTGHYRQPLNFTWESLENAKRSYENLTNKITLLNPSFFKEGKSATKSGREIYTTYKQRFIDTLGNDLQMPQVLALVWDMLKDEEMKGEDKLTLIFDWDRVLGLGLEASSKKQEVSKKEYLGTITGIKIVSQKELSQEMIDLIDQRELVRREKDWVKADEIRKELEQKDLLVKDGKEEVTVV